MYSSHIANHSRPDISNLQYTCIKLLGSDIKVWHTSSSNVKQISHTKKDHAATVLGFNERCWKGITSDDAHRLEMYNRWLTRSFCDCCSKAADVIKRPLNVVHLFSTNIGIKHRPALDTTFVVSGYVLSCGKFWRKPKLQSYTWWCLRNWVNGFFLC